MFGSYKQVNNLLPSRAFVGVGGTLALFVDIVPGQVAATVKLIGGGTLEILPASYGASLVGGGSQLYSTPNFITGSTQTLAMLGTLSGTGYMMSAAEVLNIDGPCRFYVSALSATCQVMIIKHLGSGV